MSANLPASNLLTLKRQALMVFFICYIPHITTQPAWLLMLFLAVAAYRVAADYFSAPVTPWWLHLILVVACLFILSRNVFISGFFIRFLLTFIILKYLEIHSIRDIKILILCNFFVILSALIMTQELWTIVYLLIAIVANLSIMLKASANEVSLNEISSKSSLQLLFVIPLSLLLFYIFPRIDPLWQMQSLAKANVSLSDKMSPGSISDLFNDDTTAMQITFNNEPILNGYWRAVILTYYTGETWYPNIDKYTHFTPLRELGENETTDYEILLEPTQMRWLFYIDYPIAGKYNLVFDANHGMLRGNKRPITERFSYAIKVQPTPYQNLDKNDFADATQLPNAINPRLTAWAKEQYAKTNNNPTAFIAFLRQYIHNQPFWYTLQPPLLNASLHQMDAFWFGTQKGFCEHYAGAVTFILRAAGIPARVILGYHGGKWNPITHSITLQLNNAHAWLEYWEAGKGWQLLDPTSFIASNRIDRNIQARQQELENTYYFSISGVSWRQQVSLLVDSVRFYSERWFLFYNENTQQNLLQLIGLGRINAGQLLQITVISIPILFMLMGLYYSWRQKRKLDPLLVEYHLLQKEFQKFDVATLPSATLQQQCDLLIHKVPALESALSIFMSQYEELRLKQSQFDVKQSKNETIVLFKRLRQSLRRYLLLYNKD